MDFIKEIVNIGIIKLLMALTLSLKFPLVKSTPRLAWAFKITLDSSIKLGTNLIANENIVLQVFMGALNILNGSKIVQNA